jgi:hypothetical protein
LNIFSIYGIYSIYVGFYLFGLEDWRRIGGGLED